MIEDKIIIKNCEIATRIALPPMATSKSADGKVNDDLCAYYEARSRNPHIGLIITEHSYISKSGIASKGQLSIGDDECIEGFRKLADTVHKAGNTKIFAQINHAGGNGDIELNGGELLSSSSMAYKKGTSRELTISEIKNIEDDFARAAQRVKMAGFDGVEIHSAHGYLLNQFYSPLRNKRNDEYGCQNIENRMRFQLETLKKVRDAVGDDFVVTMRLGGCDYTEGGSTIEDCVKACELLEKADIDMISLTGGVNGYIRRDIDEPGYFKDMSLEVKKHVHVPVLLTGGVKNYQQAEELLKQGAGDLIGMGRALLVNPDL